MLSSYLDCHVFPHLNQHTGKELNSSISEGRLPFIHPPWDKGLLGLGAYLPITKTNTLQTEEQGSSVHCYYIQF